MHVDVLNLLSDKCKLNHIETPLKSYNKIKRRQYQALARMWNYVDLSYIADGSVYWHNHLGRSLVAPPKAQCVWTQ